MIPGVGITSEHLDLAIHIVDPADFNCCMTIWEILLTIPVLDNPEQIFPPSTQPTRDTRRGADESHDDHDNFDGTPYLTPMPSPPVDM